MIQFKIKQLVVGIFAFLFLVSLVHGEESHGDCALEVRGVVTSHILCFSMYSFSDSHIPLNNQSK